VAARDLLEIIQMLANQSAAFQARSGEGDDTGRQQPSRHRSPLLGAFVC
jgi:hypothetical protein